MSMSLARTALCGFAAFALGASASPLAKCAVISLIYAAGRLEWRNQRAVVDCLAGEYEVGPNTSAPATQLCRVSERDSNGSNGQLVHNNETHDLEASIASPSANPEDHLEVFYDAIDVLLPAGKESLGVLDAAFNAHLLAHEEDTIQGDGILIRKRVATCDESATTETHSRSSSLSSTTLFLFDGGNSHDQPGSPTTDVSFEDSICSELRLGDESPEGTKTGCFFNIRDDVTTSNKYSLKPSDLTDAVEVLSSPVPFTVSEDTTLNEGSPTNSQPDQGCSILDEEQTPGASLFVPGMPRRNKQRKEKQISPRRARQAERLRQWTLASSPLAKH
ncbi:hypothetical protein B0T25DRAFT_580390 [Lasiosphaeria hispida]|uniref:Uncharacterized protein n=1 Tax=Lasiosphaeria hispida TaxID=260671 RepID=A0AAJ0HH06_9PEZI|nr:hypothetical protein B0T25DRAFT_580390 [Lasiosphaeria hispida]